MPTTITPTPSVRASGAFSALVPDGWTMDEWRGGNCAALVREWTDAEGNAWEQVLLPDGDLRLPTPDDPGMTWVVTGNRWLDDATGYLEVLADAELVLPCSTIHPPVYFPSDAVERWANQTINVDRAYELV